MILLEADRGNGVEHNHQQKAFSKQVFSWLMHNSSLESHQPKQFSICSTCCFEVLNTVLLESLSPVISFKSQKAAQELLMKMPKGGSLINTARTEVVHEACETVHGMAWHGS